MVKFEEACELRFIFFIVEETRCGINLIVLLSLLFSRCSSNVIKFGV